MEEKAFSGMPESGTLKPVPGSSQGETRWKTAANRILIGTTLCTITWNFWCLNYILPVIGYILLLLGYRALRQENKWFRNCFFITAVRAACFFLALILNTVIVRNVVYASPVGSALTAAGPLLSLAEFFCLGKGMREVWGTLCLPPKTGSVTALVVWYLCLCVLGALSYNGLVIAVGMVIGYIFIVRGIYRIFDEIQEAGYTPGQENVRVSDGGVVLGLMAVLLAGCGGGYLFGGSYPMEWSETDSAEQSEVEEIRERLAGLGFPEYVLNDLGAEELAACDGAERVVVETAEGTVYSGKTAEAGKKAGEGISAVGTAADSENELLLTGVGVRLSGAEERWVIFHHFLWRIDPGFCGTEALQLRPVYQGLSAGWASDGKVTGRVLYDKDGKSFAAPYYFLGGQTYTSAGIFWSERLNMDVFAAFSMPAKGENCRGYVAYPIAVVQEGYPVSSWVSYVHQRSRLQYPVLTAMEKCMTGGSGSTRVFVTVSGVFQGDGSLQNKTQKTRCPLS